jgi:hypothetical protein
MTANLSFVNFTLWYARYLSRVSSAFPGLETARIALTGHYLNAFGNSGERGFSRVMEFGKSGWNLQNCNFDNNSITVGVLGSRDGSSGMAGDSCVFSESNAEIGFR